MPGLNAITPSQLMRLIGTPAAPRLIDVTTDEDVALDLNLIPTAERAPHGDLPNIAVRIGGGSRAVIICQKGKKLSQGVAAYLRACGHEAEYLEGGNEAWREAGLPRLRISDLPARGTLWVTRHRPKIDRIASPWLILRFIDPDAKFLYVEPSAVLDVAAKLGAISFDADGASFTHGHGTCTFDALLNAFTLETPPLARLARTVRAADLGQLDADPQAAGLLALSVGLSKQYRSDPEQLAAGLPLYDALYRWARDGYDEAHASQLESKA